MSHPLEGTKPMVELFSSILIVSVFSRPCNFKCVRMLGDDELSNQSLSRITTRELRYFMRKRENKGLYLVVRNFFLPLLNCSAWPCLGPA